MARSRSTNRRGVNIWPSFVDALSTLVLVVVFALMIFVVAQQVLSNALDDTERSRSALIAQVSQLVEDLERVESERSRLLSRNSSLEALMSENTQELEDARDDLALLRIQVQDLTNALGTSASAADALEAERNSNRSLINSLRAQISDLNTLAENSEDEVSRLNRRNLELLAMLDDSQEDANQREAMIAALESSRGQL